MNSCLLPPLLLQKNSNKWIIYDMNSSFSSRTPSSISRFSSMDLNHKPFEQLYLASFGQIFTIKTKLSKFSIPSQRYLKTNGDTLSSLQKITSFFIRKINWKGHILHIWQLDQGVIVDKLIWTCLFWPVVKMDMCQIDYWFSLPTL